MLNVVADVKGVVFTMPACIIRWNPRMTPNLRVYVQSGNVFKVLNLLVESVQFLKLNNSVNVRCDSTRVSWLGCFEIQVHLRFVVWTACTWCNRVPVPVILNPPSVATFPFSLKVYYTLSLR